MLSDEATVFDGKTLFEGDHVKFFDGAPEQQELEAGELGVNLDIFRQVRDHYRKTQNNMACRVLADVCQDIADNGYVGRIDDSAKRLDTAMTTVQRWRKRFADSGLLKRHNWNGRVSVNPKVAIRMDGDGKPIKPPKNERDVFILD